MSLKFERLNRPGVGMLRPGERITEHCVTVERLRNGDLRYSVNIMVDGERIHRVIGTESEGCNRQQAAQAIETFRTKAREGRLDLPRGRKIHRRFSEAAEEYLTKIEHHPKHGRNLHRKRMHVRQRLMPSFRHLRLEKLTDFGVAQYVKRRKEEGAAQATINRELATLSHLLNRALEWGWITTRPSIDKGREDPKQIVVLSTPQKLALSNAAAEDQDPFTWMFVAIALGTAMRHSEILRIRWSEIDFEQRRIHIPQAKAGQREQPMPSALANLLKAEWELIGRPPGYLFGTIRADAKSAHRQTMSKQFRRTVERAKLDPATVTPHVLRHTAITDLVKARVDLPTIQKISGHKTLAMVQRYTHLSDEHVNEAVENLATGLSAQVTPKLHTPVAVAANDAA